MARRGIKIYLSEDEEKKLQKRAKRKKMSVSEYVRDAVNNKRI